MLTMKLDEIKELVIEVGKWGFWLSLGIIGYAHLMQWWIGPA